MTLLGVQVKGWRRAVGVGERQARVLVGRILLPAQGDTTSQLGVWRRDGLSWPLSCQGEWFAMS